MFDAFRFYLDRKKIIRYYINSGYNVVTFRRFLLQNFKYKNGQEISNDIGANESLLNVHLVYKDEELFDLKTKMIDLMDYMREQNKESRRWWTRTRSVLFDGAIYNLSWMERSPEKLVGKYEIHCRFKNEIQDIVKSLINDGDDDTRDYFF